MTASRVREHGHGLADCSHDVREVSEVITQSAFAGVGRALPVTAPVDGHDRVPHDQGGHHGRQATTVNKPAMRRHQRRPSSLATNGQFRVP